MPLTADAVGDGRDEVDVVGGSEVERRGGQVVERKTDLAVTRFDVRGSERGTDLGGGDPLDPANRPREQWQAPRYASSDSATLTVSMSTTT